MIPVTGGKTAPPKNKTIQSKNPNVLKPTNGIGKEHNTARDPKKH